MGYGLYGDNVFLNGTLTTKVPNNGQSTYAGVNTVSGVSYTIGKHDDEEKIVFWAGATGKEDTQIQASPFQVTDKGNLYAKKGYFTDSVFSDSIIEGSTIRGADIYTANIHGWDFNGKQTGALNIYNTSAGIIFKTESVKDKKYIADENLCEYERCNSEHVVAIHIINYYENKIEEINNGEYIRF